MLLSRLLHILVAVSLSVSGGRAEPGNASTSTRLEARQIPRDRIPKQFKNQMIWERLDVARWNDENRRLPLCYKRCMVHENGNWAWDMRTTSVFHFCLYRFKWPMVSNWFTNSVLPCVRRECAYDRRGTKTAANNWYWDNCRHRNKDLWKFDWTDD